MTYNFRSELSNDFSQLLETEIDYNVVIQVGKDPKATKAKFPGQEKPPVPTRKLPGQEKPIPTEERNKIPRQEKSASILEQEGQENPPLPTRKLPGQEKPIPTEEHNKIQEKSASMLLQKEQEAIQAFEGHEELKSDFKEFHVHSNILRIRSKYFNKIFINNEVEKKNDGIYYIKKPNITPQAFDFVLRYIYSGNVDITKKNGSEILEIIIASEEFMLKMLTKITEDFIIENNSRFLRNDPVGILQTAYDHESLVNLQELCLDAICFEPQILFKSDKFTQISAPLLEIIVKRDYLNLDEIEIWENLIKWGLAQLSRNNPTAATHPTTSVNQGELKRILHEFVPLIRFYEISADDYINKVSKPYGEELLPKELRDDILQFHMSTRYTPTLRNLPRMHSNFSNADSIIVDQNFISLFASWIDRKEADSNYIKAIPYKFNLLYRESRDKPNSRNIKFRNHIFHEKCDNEGATIIVAKIKDSNQIVGGYNPLDWNGSGYKDTPDSFIFYFNDRKNINTGTIGRVIDPQHAIQCRSNCGPIFGIDVKASGNQRFKKSASATSGGSLMMKSDGKWRAISHSGSNNSSYPDIGIPIEFETDDYEVFQVIKKPLKVRKIDS